MRKFTKTYLRSERLSVTSTLSACSQAMGWIEGKAADGRRVCNFLRERRLFVSRPDDVFVASYPRSGTTWLHFMTYLLVGHRHLGFEHIGQVAPWFERSLAIGWMRAADYDSLQGPRVFKTHLLPEWIPKGARSVYVWRDVKDVAVSYYHLYRTHLGFTGSFEGFVTRFRSGKLQYGAWAEHVDAWTRHAKEGRATVVRYEDLKAEPRRVLHHVAGFLGVSLGEAEADDILSLSSFEAMKAREAQFDHATAVMLERGLTKGHFVRAGRVGDGRAWPAALAPTLGSGGAGSRRPSLWHLANFLH